MKGKKLALIFLLLLVLLTTAACAKHTSKEKETTQQETQIETETETTTELQTEQETEPYIEPEPVYEPTYSEPVYYPPTYGDEGRFYVPSLGISVALYNSYEQWVCDNWDSACYFNYYSMEIIADHNYQGFSALNGSYIGMYAYIEYADGSRRDLTCTYISTGYNDGSLHDSDYQMFGRDVVPCQVLCYTCLSDCYNILCVGFN